MTIELRSSPDASAIQTLALLAAAVKAAIAIVRSQASIHLSDNQYARIRPQKVVMEATVPPPNLPPRAAFALLTAVLQLNTAGQSHHLLVTQCYVLQQTVVNKQLTFSTLGVVW